MSTPSYLSHLNPEQLRAATSIQGYNFVLAGAGSGKTSVLISRIAYMLDQGINPQNILLITFTNKAAKEMKDRVVALLGDKGKSVTACTFHSFCANVLRVHASAINLKNDFIVLDESDRNTAMDVAKEEYFDFCAKRNVAVDTENFPTNKELLKVYSMMTNNCCPIEQAVSEYEKYTRGYEADIPEVVQRFIQYKVTHNAMDYDDLLNYTHTLFRRNISIREKYDEQFQYIMCDEYQDTNPIQNNIINLISQNYPNLMVVGDDNQSIYAFRHADINNILGFKDSHENCQEFMLTENYRSTQEILDTTNAMMKYATEGIEKILHGQRHGKRPQLLYPEDEREEALWIIKDILKRNVPRHEVAIICRSGAQTFILESLLNKNHIPYNKYGGMKFMEKVVIKDLLAFLRILNNNGDEIAMIRVLQLLPGVGAKTARQISDKVKQDGFAALTDKKYQNKSFYADLYNLKNVLEYLQTITLQQQLDYLVDDFYYVLCANKIKSSSKKANTKNEELKRLQDSKDDAESLLNMTTGYTNIASFLADVVLEATHKTEDTTDRINITTIHSAKGLQYHTVYLMDCIDGITPRTPAGSKEDPEELRCMYVALTRAKERLVLLCPQYYMRNGQRKYSTLSHFLDYYDVRDTMDAYRIHS